MRGVVRVSSPPVGSKALEPRFESHFSCPDVGVSAPSP